MNIRKSVIRKKIIVTLFEFLANYKDNNNQLTIVKLYIYKKYLKNKLVIRKINNCYLFKILSKIKKVIDINLM